MRQYFPGRLLTEEPEAGEKLLGKELWLFPSGKVAGFLNLVVVDEVGVGTLRPASGRLVEFVGKHAHGNWSGTHLGVKKASLFFQ